MSSSTGALTKLDNASAVTKCSFVTIYALTLIELLDIDRIEGITGLTIFTVINGSLMMSKLAVSIANDIVSESLLLLLLIEMIQRIALFEKV